MKKKKVIRELSRVLLRVGRSQVYFTPERIPKWSSLNPAPAADHGEMESSSAENQDVSPITIAVLLFNLEQSSRLLCTLFSYLQSR